MDREQNDFAAIGGAYALPIRASFTSNGLVATITVPGADVEAFIDELFVGVIATVPGSFSDYVIAVDTISRQVLSAGVTGSLDTVLGVVPVTQTASSTALAGFQLVPFMGFDFPFFCTTGATCTIVPGAPYDPATGRANAVGTIASSLFTTFTPFGDIRLSEVTPVECDVAINARDFVAGEGVEVDLAIRSNEAAERAIELKVWLDRGDGQKLSAVNLGADGTQPLPAGHVARFTHTPLFTVDAAVPLGDWAAGCRLLDPVTGELLVQDRDPFRVIAGPR